MRETSSRGAAAAADGHRATRGEQLVVGHALPRRAPRRPPPARRGCGRTAPSPPQPGGRRGAAASTCGRRPGGCRAAGTGCRSAPRFRRRSRRTRARGSPPPPRPHRSRRRCWAAGIGRCAGTPRRCAAGRRAGSTRGARGRRPAQNAGAVPVTTSAPTVGVGLGRVEGGGDLVDHRQRQRVAPVGGVEGHDGHAVVDVGQHLGHGRSLRTRVASPTAPSTLATQRVVTNADDGRRIAVRWRSARDLITFP